MRIRLVIAFLAVALISVSAARGVNYNAAAAKHSVKEVMKLANAKGGLLSKVVEGKASDDEKKQLLDLYVDMAEGEPKKGDTSEWKIHAGNAALSAAKVVLGREGAVDELKKASDCMACHSKFK